MKNQVISLTLFLVIILLFASCYPLQKGISLINAHEYEKAIDFYSQKIAENKYVVESKYWRAIAYMNINEYQLAKNDFESYTIRHQTYYELTCLYNAICCMHLGKVDKATFLVKEAMRIQKENALAAMLRGFIYIYNEKYEDALLDINFARKYGRVQGMSNCGRSCYRFFKALIYSKLGRLPEAVEQVNRLIKSQKKADVDNYYIMGCCFLKNGKTEEANKYFQLCVDSAHQDNSVVLKAKTRLDYPLDSILKSGIPADSIILNDTVFTIPYRYYNLASYYAVKKDYEKSISYLALAFEKNVLGLVFIRIDFDIEELGKYYDLNKLYLSHGKEIIAIKS